MSLLSLKQVHIAFGGPALLEAGTLQIERDERVCLVGRNGEGKSTLLKVLAGEILPDRGEVVRARDVRISHLAQQPSGDLSGTVYEQVALDWTHEHESDHPIEKLLSQLNLDPDMPCSALSGGQRRRTLLARALVNDPDVLLLDEPTNHLDLEAIQWLETFLLRRRGTLLFVTHDRMFLRRLATRILELDRGRLTSWACDYETYLQRRQTLLEAEAGQWAEFDRKLAAEEVWIRKGIRARRTRNEGRVRELMRMREERGARRERVGTARLQAQEAGRSGDKVIEAQGLCGGYDGKEVFQDLSTRITRGDRVGIIGPNGCGKTTLIRTLLGLLPPLRGTVRYGTQLELAFFDQHREGLDPNRTVKENLCGENDSILFNGKSRNALGYLQDFLFTPDRARSPAGVLSGGERNRLMLARLFAKPSNLLVLDEPTNDLDIETLDLLEELLADYAGTVLLVSHDREFLNHVVTGTLVFEGDGQVRDYVGGYDDWVRQAGNRGALSSVQDRPSSAAAPAIRTRKRTNKEREEWAGLPRRIESLEAELDTLTRVMSDASFFQRSAAEVRAKRERMEALPAELDAAYARWQELDDQSK